MRGMTLVALVLLAAGCATPSDDGAPAAGSGSTPPTPTSADGPTPAPSTSTRDPTPSPAIEPLTFIEEELAGTWVRLQVRGAGGSNEWRYWTYTAFLEDRTMCEWKHGQESSTDSDDGDYDYAEYGPWSVTEERGGGEYLVEAEGAGIEWVFDHSNDRVWLFGFSDLQSSRATDGKTCSVR